VSAAFSSCMNFLTMSRVLVDGHDVYGLKPKQPSLKYPAGYRTVWPLAILAAKQLYYDPLPLHGDIAFDGDLHQTWAIYGLAYSDEGTGKLRLVVPVDTDTEVGYASPSAF